ncbi:MAG: hemerythrin domain-containing protein [Candidatus Omnitrophica bacterium]|nr:hemerythrin domain-containing protein [Candidatus Omnitrophota bacterium]MCA9407103.1 hemerythrin domain-containing protein [Candidatus Omnitrophota bacterium]
MSNDTVTGFYSHDHDELDAYMKSFQETKKVDFSKAKKYFEEFKYGLERHIEWEESILFPLFEEKTGMKDSGPTAVMREEHKQIKVYLQTISEKLLKDDLTTDNEEELLIDLLTAHNQKEENILYPAIDNVASDEERKVVFEKMNLTE